jgi:putative transcriptional regulator
MSLFQKHSMEGYLTGQLLVAMPQMKDPRFIHAVVYICGHDENGAMGLVINKLIDAVRLADLLSQLGIKTSPLSKNIPIHFGGPVEMGRGFVLHSNDYIHEGSIVISEEIALTATLDMLTIIAEGSGPKEKMCALGYAGWSSGQLEHELQQNAWLQVPADMDLIFHEPIAERWRKTINKIGIMPEDLLWDAGHA